MGVMDPSTPDSRLRLTRLVLAALAAVWLVAGGAYRAAADDDSDSDSAAVEKIFLNGKVFTADPDRPWVRAVAVGGERIRAVGADEEILLHASPDTVLYDLGGRTVIPGFNDAHVHAYIPQGQLLNDLSFVPGPGPTLGEVLDLIAGGTETFPEGTLLGALIGTAMLDDPDAHRFTLDAASPDHPVKLEAWAGHGMRLNSRALEALGIAENAPDPLGGHYTRFPGTDVLDGGAHEYAEHRIRRTLADAASDAEIAAAYRAFAERAVRLGVTSVQDMSVGLTQERSLRIVEAADLPLRWRVICFPLSLGEACDGGTTPSSRTVASGIKWITDGSPIERLSFLDEPYADRPETSGRFNFQPDELEAQVARGRTGPPWRQQLLFHAVGDAAIENVLSGLEEAAPAAAWRSRRPRLEHGDLLQPEDLGRVRDLGIVVVQNPLHLGLVQLLAERFGPDRFARMQPLRSLVEAGIPLALGSDTIAASVNPFLDLLLAILHPGRPEEALSREQAVTAYTAGSAYAELQEHRKGRLAPGQLADLAVLSRDIFTVEPLALLGTESLLTLVGGEVVWDAGVITPGAQP